MTKHHDPHELDKHAEDLYRDHILIEQGGTDRIRTFYLKHGDNIYGRMQSTYLLFHREGITICGDMCPGGGNRNSGVTSVLGYGLEWFVGQLSKGYLAEKFLSTGWHKDLAAQWCRDRARDIRRGECDDEITRLEHISKDRHDAAESAIELRKVDFESMSAAIAEQATKRYAIYREELRSATTKIKTARQAIAESYDSVADHVEWGDIGVERLREELEGIEPDFDFSDSSPGWGYDPWQVAMLSAIQQKFSKLYWANKERVETSIGSVDLSEVLPGGIL